MTRLAARLRLATSVAVLLLAAGCSSQPEPSAPPGAPPGASPEPAPQSAPRTPEDDERDLEAAVAIVGRRDVPRYPQARELLGRISSGSRLRPDADAYLDWIRADVLVRSACEQFDAGEVLPALAKLDEALTIEVLGPEARASVHERQRGWILAVRALHAGAEANQAGDAEGARAAYGRAAAAAPRRRVHALAAALQADSASALAPDLRALHQALLAVDPAALPAPPSAPAPGRQAPAPAAPATATDTWEDDGEWEDEGWKDDGEWEGDGSKDDGEWEGDGEWKDEWGDVWEPRDGRDGGDGGSDEPND